MCKLQNGQLNKILSNLREKKYQKYFIVGIAYKKNIEDTRESSGIKIFEYFRNNNFKIDYCDPYIKTRF